jgi:hypothetical protein
MPRRLEYARCLSGKWANRRTSPLWRLGFSETGAVEDKKKC